MFLRGDGIMGRWGDGEMGRWGISRIASFPHPRIAAFPHIPIPSYSLPLTKTVMALGMLSITIPLQILREVLS